MSEINTHPLDDAYFDKAEDDAEGSAKPFFTLLACLIMCMVGLWLFDRGTRPPVVYYHVDPPVMWRNMDYGIAPIVGGAIYPIRQDWTARCLMLDGGHENHHSEL